jgi:hypothetical protein
MGMWGGKGIWEKERKEIKGFWNGKTNEGTVVM